MPVSKILSPTIKISLVLLVSAPFITLLLAIQPRPAMQDLGPLSTDELTKIEQLLLKSAPASTARESQLQISLTPVEINLLFRYILQVVNLSPDWIGMLALSENHMQFNLSIDIAGNRLPLYLNLEGQLAEQDGSLGLVRLQAGNLLLPQSIQDFAVSRLVNKVLSTNAGFQDFSELARNIEQLQIGADGLDLLMRWEPDLIKRIASRTRQLFVPAAERRRILDYYERIRSIVATIPTNLGAVSLNTFMAPLFNYAHDSSLRGSDPVVENRAALQALAIYVNNENLQDLLGPDTASEIEPVKFIEVRLQRRKDLAQHLVFSAATTSSAGAGFVQMLSTTKEAYDAKYRSGFSFSDLTANTVGMKLATLATQDRNTALMMQSRLSAIESENDYMPQIGNNRDGMSELDFASLYDDRNSIKYEQRIADIEALILARPLFRGLGQVIE